jgi:Bacterial Ig domain
VAIYRSLFGGQYWNGSAWQSANTTVPAVLTNSGAASTNWSYTFNAPPGGTFAVAALAYDSTGNYGIAPYQRFSIADAVKPTITLATPTAGQALTARPVTISGTATDNAAIADVQIAIYRPIDPAGQFWNGTAWQTAYATVAATLANPGASTTTYTYSFNPPQAGGYFYTSAIAVDTTSNYEFTSYRLFTLPDTVAPSAVLLSPVAGNTSGVLTISGTATDNVSINKVGIAIYDPASRLYWDGFNLVPTFAYVPATLAMPGATTTSFSFTFAPFRTGTFYIAALPVDGNYNYSLTPFTIINHT